MYYSGLKKIIQGLEEKKFYDIAIMFLDCKGYKDLSIVDGSGDGGRDVICSRTDLRIQLSVRKDWKLKINQEAATTLISGKRHFIYVTNRQIREAELTHFLTHDYKQKGEVEITVFDLNKISTTLAMPGIIHKAYERFGVVVNQKISATPKEIAISNLLLFSSEAKDLRQNVIESNLKAELFKSSSLSKTQLVNNVSGLIPGVDIEHNVQTALSRLISKGEILSKYDKLMLNDEQITIMKASEEEYLQSIQNDINTLISEFNLQEPEARQLIDIALEISAKEGSLNGDGLKEIELTEFITGKGLTRNKKRLYDVLSKLSVPSVRQYGKTLDHIFSTDTFDIFRALGQNSNVTMLLDSSVAMPLLFGLSFGSAKSRYGIAAAVLNDLCKQHQIKVKVPRCYLNEMAYHGIKAFEFIEIYEVLDDCTKDILKSSGNAYLSHFSHIREYNTNLTLSQFLSYFKLSKNARLTLVENTIESLLGDHGIEILPVPRWEPRIRDEILNKKPHETSIIIDHDASVCTLLKNDSETGYIFATWDKVITDVIEGLSRIFADTPSRVTDFLSMAGGAQYESEQSFNLLTSLIHIDENKATALAHKIEQIKSVEKAYEFRQFIDNARQNGSNQSQSIESHLEYFLENK